MERHGVMHASGRLKWLLTIPLVLSGTSVCPDARAGTVYFDFYPEMPGHQGTAIAYPGIDRFTANVYVGASMLPLEQFDRVQLLIGSDDLNVVVWRYNLAQNAIGRPPDRRRRLDGDDTPWLDSVFLDVQQHQGLPLSHLLIGSVTFEIPWHDAPRSIWELGVSDNMLSFVARGSLVEALRGGGVILFPEPTSLITLLALMLFSLAGAKRKGSSAPEIPAAREQSRNRSPDLVL